MQNGIETRRRGRPRTVIPLKPWADYLTIILANRPANLTTTQELYAWLCREAPGSVQSNVETFRRVLNGRAPARPGLAIALVRAYRLDEDGIKPQDFDEPTDAFAARFESAPDSRLRALLRRYADGTEVSLEPVLQTPFVVKHFGSDVESRELLLKPHERYALSIVRPVNLTGIEGSLCLLGYGFTDRRWQMVSAALGHSLSKNVQWTRRTGLELSPSSSSGRYALYAIGLAQKFSHAIATIFERCAENRHSGSFISLRDQAALCDALERGLNAGGWTATLLYRVD